MQLESVLLQRFGYASFRPGQKEVIEKIIEGKDVIALLPTGMGKSVCYQLPGYIFHQPVLIISPLLSLMQDQVEQMKRMGEKRVVALNSFLNSNDKKEVIQYLHTYRFIFISPEMLLQQPIKQKLSELKLSLIVIDEAHCISQWGFDFRPDYLRIGEVFHATTRPPILALSATATSRVMEDIRSYLHMADPYEYIHSVDRPNIHYNKVFFRNREDKWDWILQHMTETEGPGIIYTQSRKKTDQICEAALLHGVRVSSYHAGKDIEDRQFIQQQFIDGTLDWIVATNAFGMGIHKQNVRQVIHESLPANIENYMQEVGRAGRDGEDALATLLYVDGDEDFVKFQVIDELPNEQQVETYHAYVLRQENPQQMIKSGEISETTYRVLSYWMNQLEKEQVKEVLQTMFNRKIRAVDEMMGIVKSTKCTRELLVNYFGQTLLNKSPHCCQSCGIDVKEIVIPRSKVNPETTEASWQQRITNILLGFK